MDLTDRYLRAVSFLLPTGQRDDIAAELRDVLMTRAEEKQAELGRPITREEEADLLRAFGHPLVVATRYGGGQYLIGPEIYPLYIFALKILLAITVASAVIAGVVKAVIDPGPPGPAIAVAHGVLWNGAMSDIGVLTIIGAVLQHYKIRLKFLTDWNPADLPQRPRRPLFRRRTLFDHVAGIVAQTLFILWWTKVLRPWIPYITHIPLRAGQSLDLARAPVWNTLFWPVLGLSAAALVLHGLKLMGKSERPFTRALDLALSIAVLIVSSVALRAGRWVDVTGAGLPAGALAKVDYGVNIGFQVSMIVVAVIAVCTAAYHAWRLYDHSRQGGGAAREAGR